MAFTESNWTVNGRSEPINGEYFHESSMNRASRTSLGPANVHATKMTENNAVTSPTESTDMPSGDVDARDLSNGNAHAIGDGTDSGIEFLLRRHARWMLAIYWPLIALMTHLPQSETVSRMLHGLDDVQPDKLVHFGSFVVLSLLLAFAELAGRRRSFMHNLTAGCLLAATWAFVDELTQAWFGRTTSGADITADLWGVALVYVGLMTAHPERRLIPRGVLSARVLLVLLVPLAGMGLFVAGFRNGGINLNGIGDMIGVKGDHVGHFLAGFAMPWVLLAARPFGMKRVWANRALALLGMAILGPLIEWAQGTFFDRGEETADLVAHELGVAVTTVIWALFVSIRYQLVARRLVRSGGESIPTKVGDEVSETGGGLSDANASTSHESGFVGNALTVSVLTLVSRVTGLARDAVLAAVFGLGAVADAFTLGFVIPNLFRRLFGEGALTAAFIPIYSDLLHKDKLTARRLASMCMALMIVVLGGLTLVGELILAWMASQSWSPDTHLAIRLTMMMLPYMPMICLVAMIGGILQVHGKFGAPAAAPILLNVIMIAGTLFATNGVRGEEATRHIVPIVAASVLLAGLAQLLWLVLSVIRYESVTFRVKGAGPAFKRMLVMMLPMVIGLAIFQINTLFDSMIAFGLSPKQGGPEQLTLLGQTMDYPIRDQGSVAALQWSQRLYQFPLGVFGVAVATAIFPALSAAAAADDADGDKGKQRVRNILQNGLRLTFFIGLPASVGLIIVRVPLARLIFERGQFELEHAQRVAFILIGYASAVWAYSMTHVLTRAFYAMKDSKTPLKIGLSVVVLNLVLNLTLIWWLGVAGLAWSSAICAIIQVVLLMRAIRRFVVEPIDHKVRSAWMRTITLSIVMAAVLLPVTLIWDASQMSRTHSALQLMALVGLGIMIVLIGARRMKAEELRWLIRRRTD